MEENLNATKNGGNNKKYIRKPHLILERMERIFENSHQYRKEYWKDSINIAKNIGKPPSKFERIERILESPH